MKALEILKKINDMVGVAIIGKYETDEAIAELEEAMKPKSCDGCIADCSVKDALNMYGQFWDYPCDMGCKSRHEAKEQL